MLSIPDMAIAAAAALLLFGPDQLPKVARKAGQVIRDIQNTSQSFIREMERAADTAEPSKPLVEPSLAPVSVPPSPPDPHPVRVPGEPTP
jgi:sec-independent protein translocase protein TatA